MNFSRTTTRLIAGAFCATFLAACRSEPSGPQPPDEETIAKLTVTARPATPTQSITEGYTILRLETDRDAALYVPQDYDPTEQWSLLVLLHGAGTDRTQWATPEIEQFADSRTVILLAVDSRAATWDAALTGQYDEDVAFIDDALEWAFDRVNVDPSRVAIGGFSDGASEALGIGIANAGLFSRIIAFSPSLYNVPFGRGTPDIFLAHGTQDEIVPFANSRDRVVPRLRTNGMEVNFFIFDGNHIMPDYVQAAAFEWLTDTP